MRYAPDLPTPKFKGGCVYFVRAGRTATVKIGFATNPYKRLENMQVSSPHPLYLIGYFGGGRAVEFAWHKRFRHLHIRGEWFLLEQSLRDAINQRLMEPDAHCYLRVATDWRNVRRQKSQFARPKTPEFMSREEYRGWHKTGHESGGF